MCMCVDWGGGRGMGGGNSNSLHVQDYESVVFVSIR